MVLVLSVYSILTKLVVASAYQACSGAIVELSGSNTDGSFTMALLNLLMSPFEKSNSCRFGII